MRTLERQFLQTRLHTWYRHQIQQPPNPNKSEDDFNKFKEHVELACQIILSIAYKNENDKYVLWAKDKRRHEEA